MITPDLESSLNPAFPLPTAETVVEPPEHIKPKHLEQRAESYTPVGLILRRGERITFSYGCLEHLPNALPDYQKRRIKVEEIYAGISHQALLGAEELYRKSGNLTRAKIYLTISAQELEKIKNRSKKYRGTIT